MQALADDAGDSTDLGLLVMQNGASPASPCLQHPFGLQALASDAGPSTDLEVEEMQRAA